MSFKPLLEPATLAVVGVSLQNDRHPANVIFGKNRLRYPLQVFPVNPRGGIYRGDIVYPRVTAIPGKVDLVVIAVRAEQVPVVLEDSARAGAGCAVVISGGFTETGRRDLQDRLTAISRESGLPFLGPNCIGIYAPGRVDTFFLPTERMVLPEAGGVALVGQSGGILVDQMVRFAREGVGLSVAISIGNKALVKEIDLLRHLEHDPRTQVIAFYVEGFDRNEGRDFVQAARACTKPVIVLKAGKSPGGSRAVSSHTASLAGDYAVASAVFDQTGVIEARDDLELLSYCESLSAYDLPIRGTIGVVTGSGGHGAMAVDIGTAGGMAVPLLPDAAQRALRDALSPSIREIAAVANPIDLTGSAVDEDFLTATTHLSRSPEVACVLVLLLPYIPGVSADLGARLGQLFQRERKPIIAYVPNVEKYRMLIEGFELNGIPVSSSIEGAVLMAKAMTLRKPAPPLAPPPEAPPPAEIVATQTAMRPEYGALLAAAAPTGWVLEPEAKRLLSLAGLDVPRSAWAHDPAAAAEGAARIGYPLVVKVVSPAVLHKSDVGGVAVGVRDEAELRAVFERFSRIEGFDGVLVEEMLGGVELIVGAKIDHQFGPVILLGIGGTGVEIYRDTAIRMAPLRPRDAESLVRDLRGRRLLEGFRGAAPVDLRKLSLLLLGFSDLVMTLADAIESIDLNPVLCSPLRCVVADARIMLPPATPG